MSKFLKSIFVTAIGLSFFLILLGMNDALAQVKIAKKTVKPPPEEEVQWQVSLEPVDSGEGILGSWGTTPLWMKTFNIEKAYKFQGMISDENGGVIITGRSRSCQFKSWMLKLSAKGVIEKEIGSTDIKLEWLCWTSDGGYMLAGTYMREPDYDIILLKFSIEDELEWQRRYQGGWGEILQCIQQTHDGGYLVTGMTTAYQDKEYIDPNWEFQFSLSLWILKLSAEGNIEWQRLLPGLDMDYDFMYARGKFTGLQAPDGGYVFVCHTTLFGEGWQDLWVIKLSSEGQLEWQKTYGGIESERLYPGGPHAQITEDGGIVIACTSLSFGAINPENNGRYASFWVLKLFPDGAIEWQRTFGGYWGDVLKSIQKTKDGGVILAGYSKSFSGENQDLNIWLLKISSAGKVEWQRVLGNEYNETAWKIAELQDGTYAVGGFVGADVMVARISQEGEIGGGCEISNETQAIVTETFVVPGEIYVPLKKIDGIVFESSAFFVNLDISSKIICWNLHQPPENVSVTQKSNKSFFKTEYYNRISWSPNSWNGSFDVTHYRIYRDEGGSGYQLLAEVAGSTTEFLDGPVGGQNAYYTIVSVVEGVESPRSEPVK